MRKFAIALIGLFLITMIAIAAFHCGKQYAITNAKASYNNGTILIEIDGEIYEHNAENMEE